MKKPTSRKEQILIVDDNEDLLKAARIFLKRHFEKVDVEKNPESIPVLMKNERYDVILLDMNFTKDVSSGKEGFFWLDKILSIDPSAVVVMITAYGDVQTAVQCIKSGATDFVLKPWENEKLLATIFAALQLRQSKDELEALKQRQQFFMEDAEDSGSRFIASSPSMLKVLDLIGKVASTDANILLLGENGVGKDLIARAIHRKSLRADEVFINVDMGALHENLFESELFGHKKGAFTDAKSDKAGRLELANKGTLFLDEIGNLPLPLQAKLLSVLQNRKFTRLGDHRPIDFDTRLISATNMPLHEMVVKGEFRQDLLYRINTIEITIPPLRERKEDIPLLADYFLEEYKRKYKKEINGFSEATKVRMMNYEWPGNVRELQHAIERSVILGSESMIQPHDLFVGKPPVVEQKKEGGLQLEDYNLEEVEKILIRKVMEKYQGNVTYAADELGLTRSSLYRRMEKYGL